MMEKYIVEDKLNRLRTYIKNLGAVAVAFSGGVDSTLLLYVAKEQLGDKAIAFTCYSQSFPEREAKEAHEFCENMGVRQVIVTLDQLQIPGFVENPKNRCYICKRKLFETMRTEAERCGITAVIEGSNVDDEGDYRPGLIAIKELGVLSPFRSCGLTKKEIRELSKQLGLPTWKKPSFACLSTRFVYGERITTERLRRVELAEQKLYELGFAQFRVRMHGNVARIELLAEDLEQVTKEEIRSRIVETFTELGFIYVTLDLQGYRMGSMNTS